MKDTIMKFVPVFVALIFGYGWGTVAHITKPPPPHNVELHLSNIEKISGGTNKTEIAILCLGTNTYVMGTTNGVPAFQWRAK